MTNFTPCDWSIVVLYVIGAGAAGWFCRRYVHDMADFIVAGRKLNVYLAIATISGTEMGLVTVMYMAEEGYKNGFAAMTIGIAALSAFLILGFTGFLIKPFRESGAMTIAEYYEIRFNRRVRWFGGVVIAGAGILNMGVFLKAGATFLSNVTGIPETIAGMPSVNVVMTVMLIVVLFYTLLGGMVSVVVTDYAQFVILSLGIGLATVAVFWKVGLGNIAWTVEQTLGAKGLSPFANPAYGVSWVLWQFLLFLGASAIWQTAAMRVSASKNTNVVLRMYRWSSLTWMGRAIIPMLWGCAALVLIGAGAKDSLAAMPQMLAQVVPAGVIGILTAGMLAAFMSTHDSYLLAWSAVLTQDVVNPLYKDGLPERTRLWLTRAFIVGIGLFLLIWGLWYELSGTMWSYLALTGTMYLSGALAIMVCGMYWKGANATGAYAAIATGVVFPLAHLFLKDPVNAWLKESYETELSAGMAGLMAYGVSMLSMIVGSLIGNALKKAPDGGDG